MATISNCAEGGTQGTTASSSNTGAESGTALDSQTIDAGCSLTFDAAAAFAGALGYRFVMASGNIRCWQRLPGLNAAGRVVLRLWFKLDTVPTQTEYICSLRSASAQVCVMTIGTDGKLVMQNAAGAGITSGANGSSASSRATNAISANTWYRLELSATKGTTTSNGSLEYAYYQGNSGTAEFSWTGTTNVNAGTANITSVRLGRLTGAASSEARTLDLDGILFTELASGWYGIDPVLEPSGIASGEAFGSPTISMGGSGVTVEPSGISSAETLGSPTISTALTASPGGIPSGETLGSPVISTSVTASPGGISTGEAVGSPVILTFLDASPGGIASGEAFGTPTIQTFQTVNPLGIASEETIGTPLVGQSNGPVTPQGISSGESFGTPFIFKIVQADPVGFDASGAVGTPELQLSLTASPAGIAGAEAFGNPVLTPTVIPRYGHPAGSLGQRNTSGSTANRWEGNLA